MRSGLRTGRLYVRQHAREQRVELGREADAEERQGARAACRDARLQCELYQDRVLGVIARCKYTRKSRP